MGGRRSTVPPSAPRPVHVRTANSPSHAMTFGQALERYKAEESPSKRGSEQEIFRIAAWSRHPLSEKLLSEIKRTDLVDWRRMEEARIGPRGTTISPSTIRNKIAIISALYEYARSEWGMIELVNPVRGMRLPKNRRGRDVRLTDQQVDRLLKEARREGRAPYLFSAASLATLTAMRQGELLAARWENWNGGRVLNIHMTKNGESRAIPLSKAAYVVLSDWWTKAGQPTTGPVFPGVVRSSIVRAWMNCVRAVRKNDPSFPHVTFHDLRHVAATRLSKKLPNVLELSAVTGHKSLQVLKRYYNPDPEDLARKLD